MKKPIRLWALFTVSLSLGMAAQDSQTIVVDHSLQIPGQILPAGTYTFSLGGPSAR